ncbi:MAG: hypothetical protein ACFCU6_02480 [Balneolaceae bacterium]
MQGGARLFAYVTWVLMISLGIIVFANPLLVFITDPGWVGLVALLAFGFVYLNLSYGSIRRFISKVPEPTNLHYVLAFLIFLPPGFWIIYVNDNLDNSRFITIVILAFSTILGAIYGNKSGIKTRNRYIQKVKNGKSDKRF